MHRMRGANKRGPWDKREQKHVILSLFRSLLQRSRAQLAAS